jgi:GNAT superfamily N-acetyltransferase
MTARPIEISPLRDDQIEAASALLARAFHDDPPVAYMYPDPDDRSRLMPVFMRWNLRHCRMYGETYGTEKSLIGAVMLYPPGVDVWTDARLAQSGFDSLADRLGAYGWDRLSKTLNAVADADEQLHQTLHGPHWYLHIIGIDPVHQGLGIGGALLRGVNERTDREGSPTALVTYQPTNLPFYLRHGYEMVCQGIEPTGGLSYWGFRRPAGAPNLESRHVG